MPYAAGITSNICSLNKRSFVLNTERSKIEKDDIADIESSAPKDMSGLKMRREETDGRLYIGIKGKDVAVHVKPCFPWSCPEGYLSLRDDEDNEMVLIEDLKMLDDNSRKCLEQALLDTVFVIRINKVVSCKEEFEVRTWEVVTQQGPRKFQTKRDAWPRILPQGKLLIEDVAGDLYSIDDPYSMDAHSRKQLASFID